MSEDETEPSLNYANPEVLRSGLIHLRHRIDENLDVPHYREYHLEVIDAALQLIGSVTDSASAEPSATTRRSAAPESSSSLCPPPSEEP